MIGIRAVAAGLLLTSVTAAQDSGSPPGGAPDKDKPPTLKIAALRVMPERWNKEANLRKLEKYAREAASRGAGMVITCEGFLDGYVGNNTILDRGEVTRKRYHEFAEPVDGPSLRLVGKLARDLQIYIVFGFAEREAALTYNSVVVFDPAGRRVHHYRKTHIKGERFNEQGTDFGTFDTRFGKMGTLICYDRQLPEPARILAVKGARLLLVPSYGAYGDMNDAMMRTRAKENGVYLVFCHPKRTLIVDPEGDVLAQDRRSFGGDNYYGDGDQVVLAEIRLDEGSDEGTLPMRRPGLYRALVEEKQ